MDLSLSIVYSFVVSVVVDACFYPDLLCCMPLSPLARTKVEKKTCDRPPYLSLACSLSLSLHTIITIRRVASSLAVGVLQLVGQPVKTLVQTVAAGCAGRLNVPVAVPQRVQAQLVGDFGGVHRIW